MDALHPESLVVGQRHRVAELGEHLDVSEMSEQIRRERGPALVLDADAAVPERHHRPTSLGGRAIRYEDRSRHHGRLVVVARGGAVDHPRGVESPGIPLPRHLRHGGRFEQRSRPGAAEVGVGDGFLGAAAGRDQVVERSADHRHEGTHLDDHRDPAEDQDSHAREHQGSLHHAGHHTFRPRRRVQPRRASRRAVAKHQSPPLSTLADRLPERQSLATGLPANLSAIQSNRDATSTSPCPLSG